MSTTPGLVNYFQIPEGGIKALMGPNAEELSTNTQKVDLYDVRGEEDKYHLDNAGFQYIKHTSAMKDWDDMAEIDSVYLEEIKAVVKGHFGATTVHIDSMNRRGPTSTHFPIPRAHIDRTPQTLRDRLHEVVGMEEQERLNKENVPLLFISCWRPTKTIHRDPLVVCDKRTVNNDTDLADVPRPTKKYGGAGRIFLGKQNPNHKWLWQSEQTPEDLLFLKLVDLREGHEDIGGMHSSATLPGSEDQDPRESIEVRVIATWE